MKTTVELTYEELFLLEMAVDEVLWKLNISSPNYNRYKMLDEMLFTRRVDLRSKCAKGSGDND